MKKVCSFILMCALAFGSIGFTQSQISTAYALPSDQVGLTKWCVYGEKDLRDDLRLVDVRNCPQGKETVRNMINICIRENKKLVVDLLFDILKGGECWYYSIM